MIVLDKPKLKFLLAGRTITVTVPHDWFRRGRSYSVSTAYNKPASCTATVVGIRVTASGRELEIRQNREKPERYIARSVARGYTTNPDEAIQDEAAWALGTDDLKSLAGANRRRHEREQHNEMVLKQARSISLRLREAARAGDTATLRKLRKEIRDLEKRMEAA